MIERDVIADHALDGILITGFLDNRFWPAQGNTIRNNRIIDVTQDGWEPVPVGGSATYQISAEPFGLHPYHCHALPVSEHMAHGLYGVMIVDPPGGGGPPHTSWCWCSRASM